MVAGIRERCARRVRAHEAAVLNRRRQIRTALDRRSVPQIFGQYTRPGPSAPVPNREMTRIFLLWGGAAVSPLR